MLIPVFGCSSLGTRVLKWLGSSHNLKFSGIQVASLGGSLLILVTDSSRHKEPKIGVLESTQFRGGIDENDSKWGCSFFHILVPKSCILYIGNTAPCNNWYFWFRLDTIIIKMHHLEFWPLRGVSFITVFRTTPEWNCYAMAIILACTHIKLTKPWT